MRRHSADDARSGSRPDVARFIADLRGRGVGLASKGDRLAASIPKEVFTVELQAELETRKAEILSFLRAEEMSGEHVRSPDQRPTSYAPASFAQTRMWFLDQLDPGNTAYNIVTAVRLRGALNPTLLEQSLRALVDRHDVLRTTFVIEGDEPVQVLRRNDLSLQIVDLPPDAGGFAGCLSAARENAARPFDLQRDLMLRAALYRAADRDHQLLLVTHHIAADGWSMALLLRDLLSLYQAALTGGVCPLPPLTTRYVDFARWQRANMVGPRLEAELTHWRDHLEGAELALELPYDRSRPISGSRRAGARKLAIPSSTANRLRQLGRGEAATPFVVVLTGLAILLFRYTERSDLIIGTAVSSRERADTENLVGPFSNVVLLRIEVRGDVSARELVRQVRRETQRALAHQELPFEKVVEQLRAHEGKNRRPEVPVMFSFHEDRSPRPPLPDLELEVVPLPVMDAKFDLTFEITNDGQDLTGHVAYDAARFDEETIARVVSHFDNLLTAMATAPDQSISSLPMLEPAEHDAALAQSGNWPIGNTELLHRRFARWAAETPQKIALRQEADSVTYAALDERANRLARHLLARGAHVESRIAIDLPPGVELIVAVLAVLKVGAAYVPLDPAWPAERVASVLADASAALLVSEAAVVTALPTPPCPVVLIDRDRDDIERHDAGNVDSHANDKNLAYVIFTSGSTGRPKGVAVTHANVAHLFEAAQPTLGFGPDDVWTLFHSIAFDFSVWEMWGALAHGGSLVIVSHATTRSPAEFLDLVRREKVTVLSQTPSAFRQFSEADAMSRPALALRWVVFGGERLDFADVASWIDRRGDTRPRLANMYGITETTVHVTFRALVRNDVHKSSRIGRPLAHLRLYLLDAALEPVPIGVPGEIYVGGAGVARGYVGRPDLTAARFLPDPWSGVPGARLYRSGDRARRLPDGDLEYLGRADRQVKVRGYRIELGEIEAAVRSHPDVAGAAVVCTEDTPSGRLVAFVVRRSPSAISEATLREFARTRLPSYMVPAQWIFVEQFPMTRNGKLDRTSLLSMTEATPAASSESRTPSTPTQTSLARIWQDLLHTSQFGIDDDFFDSGGHSVLATRLVARVRDELGVDLPLRVVFEGNATIRRLAAVVEQQRIDQTSEAALTSELRQLEELSDEEVRALLQCGDSDR